jgi:hypothetical protein
VFISNEEIKELTLRLVREVKESKHLSDILEINIEHEVKDVKYLIKLKKDETTPPERVRLLLLGLYKSDYAKGNGVYSFLSIHELNYFYKTLGTLTEMFKACNEYITENYIEV